mgnify:CR=1 FL=1
MSSFADQLKSEIARIARGISHEQFEAEPSLFTIINSNSPRKLDTPMLQGIMEMSSRNQIVMLTPFTLAGAMAPVTIAGAVALSRRRVGGAWPAAIGVGRARDGRRRARCAARWSPG